MRKPQICYEKGDEAEHRCNPESSGTLARVKRFLSLSLGGGRRSPSSLERSCMKPCMNILPSSSLSMLTNLKAEAEHVLGRPLDELKLVPDLGVPAFVHALCCYMLTNGVDYETLVTSDWDGEGIKSSLRDGVLYPFESLTDEAVAAALLRLFLQELPQPLLNKETTESLMRLTREIDNAALVRSDQIHRIQNILTRKLKSRSLNLLQYLTNFLHQLQIANHNTCPVPSSQLGRVLARVLTEEGMKDTAGCSNSFILAETLLLNHATIFGEGIRMQATDYNSDSVSSNCDSRGEETGEDDEEAFSPAPDGILLSGGDEVSSNVTDDVEDDSSTSTSSSTDTDDFQSLPVSPLNRPGGPSSSPFSRITSTADVTADVVDTYHAKIAPCGKKFLPSITGFVTSAGESWTDEKLRRDVDSFDSLSGAQSAESSCVSGGDVSDENEGDRDADGSEAEATLVPCPHDERRFSERFFYPRIRSSNSSRRPKRKTRRKHTKDGKSSRVASSEEEEKNVTEFTSTHISREDEQPATSGSIAVVVEPEPSTELRDLVESSDPVQSDRSSWCLRRDEESFAGNCQRTAKHFSREDYDKSLEPTSWYRSDNREDNFAPTGSKYSEPTVPGLCDDFDRPKAGGSQTAIKTLSKHISSLKKKIKRFEEEFEISFAYRPSHSEKSRYPQVKRWLAELSKVKKELKQMKDEMPERKRSNSYPMSLLRCQESTSQISASTHQSPSDGGTEDAAETLRKVEERLSTKRDDAGRPNELFSLSLDQYKDEKIDLQKALLYYESVHGRPVTREDRDRVRPLYDRYRQVKRGIVRLSTRSKECLELAPILEHEAMDFTLASPQHRGSIRDNEEEEEEEESTLVYKEAPEEVRPPVEEEEEESTLVYKEETRPPPRVSSLTTSSVEPPPPPPSTATEINLGDLHALPIHELKERKRAAKEHKKKIRKILREFEEKFERERRRKMQKEERGPMERTYTQYKHVKAKLRLLEALLSKHDSW